MPSELSPQKQAWLDEQNRLQPRREELFKIVRDPKDWKAPIAITIDVGVVAMHKITVDEMEDAVVHFTGASCLAKMMDNGTMRVHAVGYRAGPCGDH